MYIYVCLVYRHTCKRINIYTHTYTYMHTSTYTHMQTHKKILPSTSMWLSTANWWGRGGLLWVRGGHWSGAHGAGVILCWQIFSKSALYSVHTVKWEASWLLKKLPEMEGHDCLGMVVHSVHRKPTSRFRCVTMCVHMCVCVRSYLWDYSDRIWEPLLPFHTSRCATICVYVCVRAHVRVYICKMVLENLCTSPLFTCVMYVYTYVCVCTRACVYV